MWHKGVRWHYVESDTWKKVQGQKHPGRWGIVEQQIPSIKVLFKTNAKSHKHPGIKLLSSESKTQLVNQRKQNSYIIVYIYIYILTQSFWTGTKVIRRKHIMIQLTGFGACSSTCCHYSCKSPVHLKSKLCAVLIDFEQIQSHPKFCICFKLSTWLEPEKFKYIYRFLPTDPNNNTIKIHCDMGWLGSTQSDFDVEYFTQYNTSFPTMHGRGKLPLGVACVWGVTSRRATSSWGDPVALVM